MPFIKINDKELEVEKGSRLLQVALDNGVDLPHYCYHEGLSIAGNCRMCCVEVDGMPGLQISCNVTIGELPQDKKVDGKYDMVVRTESEEVKDSRSRVLELLLLNHPIDCPVCDQAGECYLQDYSFAHGNAHSRFEEEKRVNPKKQLGHEIWIYPNRCVLCSRCIRFCDEIVGDPQLIVRNRGYNSIIDVRDSQPLDNKLSGNTADICPVGSLVSNDFLHKTRVWNLTETETICKDCSVGCNIKVGTTKNEIQRIKPRRNDEVNSFWMCDDGRLGYHSSDKIERIQSPMIKEGDSFKPVSWTEAFEALKKSLLGDSDISPDNISFMGSANCTNEENYLIRKIAESLSVPAQNLCINPGKVEGEPIIYKSGFRISPDKTPNRNGAIAMMGLKDSADENDPFKGKIKAVYLHYGATSDYMNEANLEAIKKLDYFAVQSAYMSDAAKLADLILPASIHYEKNGTMLNDSGRVQRLMNVIEPPIGVREDWKVLSQLGKALGCDGMDYKTVDEITDEIAGSVKGFENISSESLGSLGISIDSKIKEMKEVSA